MIDGMVSQKLVSSKPLSLAFHADLLKGVVSSYASLRVEEEEAKGDTRDWKTWSRIKLMGNDPKKAHKSRRN